MSRECTGKTHWYPCSQGPFQACCSVDACTNGGVCPDDDNGPSQASTSTSQRTTSTKTTSTKQSTTFETMTTSTGRLGTSSSSTSSTTSSTTTSSRNNRSNTSTRDSLGPNAEGNDGAPIGAIVGGVIGGITFLILLVLALGFAYRRRKKRVRRSTLVRWRGPLTYGHKGAIFDANSSKPPPNDPASTEEKAIHTVDCFSHPSSAIAKQEKPDTGSLPIPTDYSNGTIRSPTSPASTAAELDGAYRYPSKIPYSPVTQRTASTSELSYTGVHRPPAELAAQPTRELINLPPQQRQRSPTLPTQSRERTNSPPASPPVPIITADGVVLSANFDTSAPNPQDENTNTLHAMSFMDYDVMRRSMLVHEGGKLETSEEDTPSKGDK
ncbi:hypothetical protein BBP40_007381 [Aspergillus hancockii]|nr:hypothetical protein BBP40_007381 [Aspergillus hancockii]